MKRKNSKQLEIKRGLQKSAEYATLQKNKGVAMFGIDKDVFYTLNQLKELPGINIGRVDFEELLKDTPVVELKKRKLYLGADVLHRLRPNQFPDIGAVPKRDHHAAS